MIKTMAIRILDDWTIIKIKAGQVISSYKDIVKELVENAIDAESTSILIYLNFNNKTIRVIDNGIGMSLEDLKLCLMSHTTSKFTSLDNINSFGFRGEGLHVISECSHVKMVSKTKDNNGYKIQKNYQGDIELNVEATNLGTEVIVEDIFCKTPGKIQFLSLNKDFINSVTYIQYLSLAFPNIKFHIYKNDNYYLYLYGGDNYEELIYQIFKIRCSHIIINEKKYSIKMYINTNLKDERGQILFFVNKRPVNDFGLLRVIKKLLQHKTGANNLYFLLFFLEIDQHFVDFNLVADKSQVKISILEEIQDKIAEYFSVNSSQNSNSLHEQIQFLEEHNLSDWFTYKNKYIIANYNEKIYMIDHHALSERLLFQTLEHSYYHTQLLLDNISIDLTEEEMYILQEKSTQLADLKFKHQIVGNYLLIYEIPDFLDINEVNKVIKDFIYEDNFHIFLHKLSNISCKNSLKAGYKVTEEEIKEFIMHLNTNSSCQFCNHGRNVCHILDEKAMDKIFGRR